MTEIQDLELTIYFVGANKNEAFAGLPFDSAESAESYQEDEGGTIYSATAIVQAATLKKSRRNHR